MISIIIETVIVLKQDVVEFVAGTTSVINAIYATTSVAISGLANTLANIDFTTLGLAGAIEIKSTRIVEQQLGNAMPKNINCKTKKTQNVIAMRNTVHTKD